VATRRLQENYGSSLFQLFGVAWVMPQRVGELLVSWRGQLRYRTALEIWRLAYLCLMWCIWRERNTRSFEYCETEMFRVGEDTVSIPLYIDSSVQ
jgi:hypothetical protein